MSLRRCLSRLTLCIAFVLASIYVQAIAHVDDLQINAAMHATTKLPPCHQTMNDDPSKGDNGHHGGCCSNVACTVGLIVDNVPRVLPKAIVVHALDLGNAESSGAWQPQSPPPKRI